MEESQRSETVVGLPDMSEPLANEADGDAAGEGPRTRSQTVVRPAATAAVAVSTRQEADTLTAHPIAVAAAVPAGTVAVPVSLPVGSIIGVANAANGTTFNVITTSDQLQVRPDQDWSILPTGGQFKQMLCVDNGFICESRADEKISDPLRWNGELKTTHIVIQNSTEETDTEALQSTAPSNTLCSWTECANMAVLPVRCKNTNAELHKNRFGSGGRGRCIKLGNEWYTPSEFEALCGRASSKDWKRSIRFGGRSLQTLIDEQILRPHATSCTCSACCDDDSAAGPIRLFTPYKRRRRTRDPLEGEEPPKKKGESSRDGSNNDDSDSEIRNSWQTFVSTDDIVIQHTPESEQITPNVQQPTENGQNDSRLNKLEEMSSKLLKMAYEFKRTIEELKAEEGKQQRREQNIIHIGGKNDVIETVGLQPSSDLNNKRCANCNRDAFAECSLCRRTPYCSTFCQRKDWTVHQVECVRDATETVMLIVESSTGETSTLTAQTTADQ